MDFKTLAKKERLTEEEMQMLMKLCKERRRKLNIMLWLNRLSVLCLIPVFFCVFTLNIRGIFIAMAVYEISDSISTYATREMVPYIIAQCLSGVAMLACVFLNAKVAGALVAVSFTGCLFFFCFLILLSFKINRMYKEAVARLNAGEDIQDVFVNI